MRRQKRNAAIVASVTVLGMSAAALAQWAAIGDGTGVGPCDAQCGATIFRNVQVCPGGVNQTCCGWYNCESGAVIGQCCNAGETCDKDGTVDPPTAGCVVVP